MFLVNVTQPQASMTAFANQQSPVFKQKMRNKLSLLLQVLTFGFNVLYIDSDVILLKDPFPYLQSFPEFDLLAQRDDNICSGFMYFVSNPRSIAMMTRAYQIVQKPNMRDQIAVNNAVEEKKTSYALLPTNLFPSGGKFFSRYQFFWDRTGRRAVRDYW